MHRAIIFDIGKVLVPFDCEIGYKALEHVCPYGADEIRRRLSNTDLVEQFEKGLIEPRTFAQQLSAVLHLGIDYGEFSGI